MLESHGKVSLNKKHKQLVVSTKEQRQKLKICILVIVLLLGFVPPIIALEVMQIAQINGLEQF